MTSHCITFAFEYLGNC